MNRAAALVFLLVLPPTVFGHPEIQSQIEILDEQLQHQPDNPRLLMQRADLNRRHGEYAAAERDLLAASRADPVPVELPFFEGWLQLETGRAAAAEKSFSRYLADRPGHVKAHILRAQARFELGQMELAAEDYSLSIRLSQSPSPDLYRLNALSLAAAGERQWPAGRAVIDSGLARFPGEISLLGLGTDIALAQDDDGGARVYLSQVSEAVRALPQWKGRFDLNQQLRDVKPANRAAALQTAQEKLLRQVTN